MKMRSCKVIFNMPWDVLIDEHENVEMPSQSSVKFTGAYVEVGESRVLETHLLVN